MARRFRRAYGIRDPLRHRRHDRHMAPYAIHDYTSSRDVESRRRGLQMRRKHATNCINYVTLLYCTILMRTGIICRGFHTKMTSMSLMFSCLIARFGSNTCETKRDTASSYAYAYAVHTRRISSVRPTKGFGQLEKDRRTRGRHKTHRYRSC
jgi:hypothetical protein